MYSDSIENEETLYRSIFIACQNILKRTGTFERLRQTATWRVLSCTDAGAGHF